MQDPQDNEINSRSSPQVPIPNNEAAVTIFERNKPIADLDINFKGSLFTWWNGRIDDACIFKRLDKIVLNQAFLGLMGRVELDHLARVGFDHAPLPLTCGGQSRYFFRPFKFLKFWIEEEDFKDVVKQNWTLERVDDIFIALKQKMKKTKNALNSWSREKFGDIFKKLKLREDIVRIKEDYLRREFLAAVNRSILQRP
ncbi:hypothetical protein H5410_061184 [Solanum commersonii]|uniref:Uncharacterized protein n=1 Tax=Solanum commersonii TaxID=4109 RepID=A0A9J5W7A9_SOLCO|nr:hypothetical protein H5410_061184 [Solanum commersonii]